jgi:D-alanine-D-alanine ligase
MRSLNITVMYGGESAEREISIKSGTAVAKALASLGHNVMTVDPIDPDWVLPVGTDVVFLALHGTFGEDGRIQEQLEKIGVPYTGCGVEASRIGFDKIETKRRCVRKNVPTPRYFVARSPNVEFPKDWKFPVVVKPARQGSSVGLQIVEKAEQWNIALIKALEFDSEVLVEEFIKGKEVTVAILDETPLPIVEIRPKSGVYDYTSKYTVGATEYICPANIDPVTAERIRTAALSVFRAVGARDYARVDLIVSDVNPYVLEINTLPGMTETSLFPKAAAAAGISYPQLCEKMVELALRRSKHQIKKSEQKDEI